MFVKTCVAESRSVAGSLELLEAKLVETSRVLLNIGMPDILPSGK